MRVARMKEEEVEEQTFISVQAGMEPYCSRSAYRLGSPFNFFSRDAADPRFL